MRQTVPTIDNVIKRRSRYQPSWLILKCHSGRWGIHPQYPPVEIAPASGWVTRVLFTRRDVWEKKLDLGNYTLSPLCYRSLTIVVSLAGILTLLTHTCLRVLRARPLQPGICGCGAFWGCEVTLCRNVCVCNWTVVVSASESSLNKSPGSFFRVYFSLSGSSKFTLDVPNTRIPGPSFCKNILWYKQSWEGLR